VTDDGKEFYSACQTSAGIPSTSLRKVAGWCESIVPSQVGAIRPTTAAGTAALLACTARPRKSAMTDVVDLRAERSVPPRYNAAFP